MGWTWHATILSVLIATEKSFRAKLSTVLWAASPTVYTVYYNMWHNMIKSEDRWIIWEDRSGSSKGDILD